MTLGSSQSSHKSYYLFSPGGFLSWAVEITHGRLLKTILDVDRSSPVCTVVLEVRLVHKERGEVTLNK